jgi:hypothetical protein
MARPEHLADGPPPFVSVIVPFAAGYRQVFAEDACVPHPARSTLRELCRKWRRNEGARQDRRLQRGCSTASQLKELCRGLRPPITRSVPVFRQRTWPRRTRIEYALIAVLHHYVLAAEHGRLLIGGSPRR